MPEDVAFISSKSGVDTSRDAKVMNVAKKVPTDGKTAFRLYIRSRLANVPALSCRSR